MQIYVIIKIKATIYYYLKKQAVTTTTKNVYNHG